MRLRILAVANLFFLAWFSGGLGPSQAAELQALKPPWQVNYYDGSANLFRFWQDAPDADLHFDYVPVKPEASSTGFYSGGEAKQGTLRGKQAEQLRRWILKLGAATDQHTPDRAKGTGAFAVKTGEGTSSFIVQMGALLREFEDFLRPLKK